MAHPKRKTSKTRRDKRRTHDKATIATLSKCPTTGTVHRRHTAYEVEGNVYYNGKLMIEKKENA
ncbi:MAG: 50S ribosomal protein L32 [Bacteroidetes bacterium ADurb.Bin217]|mgnify:CR=1 FL=1|nr:MAG: 50S ribosomal protein L32 [Bacteroidetes bacterium ADurb.Bin217]HOS84676.1 50S ribosomal protein L32 [Bacteroidales bacterium]